MRRLSKDWDKYKLYLLRGRESKFKGLWLKELGRNELISVCAYLLEQVIDEKAKVKKLRGPAPRRIPGWRRRNGR